MTNKNYKAIAYRSDIDGLRAIAVLSVLIFHLNGSWLPGGYLGVDVFFVISGYLITSIINRQLENGTFSFKDFYTRRVKRILPLFFTVLIPTVIVAAILLLPEDYERFWRSARYAMQFRANRAFMGDDYFDVVTEEKPLLHMWSLAIEEQFYFFWPLSFWLIYKVFKRKERKTVYLFCIAILTICMSTIIAEESLQDRTNDSYFLLRNRAAELLIGCALAFLPFSISQRYKYILGFIGSVVLIFCFIIFSSDTPIPGIYVLLPTIAAALFILDDSQHGYKKIFTWKPIRLIGLWSFSIYLWHWPILAFMRYVQQSNVLPLSFVFIAFIATITLSCISYYLIENIARRNKMGFIANVSFFLILPMIFVYMLSSFLNSVSIYPENIALAKWDLNRKGCFDQIADNCNIGDIGSSTKYLLIGDSHALHLGEMMDIIGKKEGIDITLISFGQCSIKFQIERLNFTDQCNKLNSFLEQNINNYDKILLSEYFYGHKEIFKKEYNYVERTIQSLENIAHIKPVIIISDIPSLVYSLRREDKLEKLGFSSLTIEEIRQKQFLETNNINSHIQHFVRDKNNIYFLDIIPYFNRLVTRYTHSDTDHITIQASTELGELFIEDNELISK